MEEPKKVIPEAVDDAEIIDRVVYEPSFFCEGRLAPAAFDLSKKDEKDISVFRKSYYNFADIIPPKPRTKGDSVAGVAQLLVENVRAIASPNPVNSVSVTVEASGTKVYPFHASIFTTIDGVPVKGGTQHTTPWFMYVQKELVSRATFVPVEKLAVKVPDKAV